MRGTLSLWRWRRRWQHDASSVRHVVEYLIEHLIALFRGKLLGSKRFREFCVLRKLVIE